jgi:hypothetical protein
MLGLVVVTVYGFTLMRNEETFVKEEKNYCVES